MRLLVTAGPTREPLDPVRFVSNRSSGKMGYAIAAAAVRRGHETTLVSGPVSLDAPDGVRLVNVTTAQEMHDAVLCLFPSQDALVMAAAVADWRPASVATEKLKKADAGQTLVLQLERTVDILDALIPMRSEQIVVGFAAETQRVVDAARRKLVAKRLDAIVVNDVSQADAGFEADTNRVVLLSDTECRHIGLATKREIGDALVGYVEELSECRRHRAQ